MNFLSHYYFDRNESEPERVLGAILPDLLKNADKTWVIKPEKEFPPSVQLPGKLDYFMQGWRRHIYIDKLFHSSAFFLTNTAELREIIKPVLHGSPVRPSFLAHIALELMLDSLLLTNGNIDADEFYRHLKSVDEESLDLFLTNIHVPAPLKYYRFMDDFIGSRYLATYGDTGKVVYALGQICRRIWDDPFTEQQKEELRLALLPFLARLGAYYHTIFDEIEAKLSPYT